MEWSFEDLELEKVLEEVAEEFRRWDDRHNYIHGLHMPMYSDLEKYIDDPVFIFLKNESEKALDNYLKYSSTWRAIRKLIRKGK